MTESRPGGQPRPFTSAELDGASGVDPSEFMAGTRVARDLEALAAATPVTSSADFTDRVMGAIAGEPAPAPARLARLALRRRSLGAFVASVRDAWRVTTSPRFPMAARAQAMALVLVVAALATGSGMATAGALGLLDDNGPKPTQPTERSAEPSVDASDDASTPDASEDPSESPDGSESAEPSESPDDESADPSGSEEPGESADDHGGGGANETSTPGSGDHETARPTRTPSPTASDHEEESDTPKPSQTPKPSETPHASGSGGDDG